MVANMRGCHQRFWGVHPPEVIITELVEDQRLRRQERKAADAIAAGEREAIPQSDVDFIVKASGIERRHDGQGRRPGS